MENLYLPNCLLPVLRILLIKILLGLGSMGFLSAAQNFSEIVIPRSLTGYRFSTAPLPSLRLNLHSNLLVRITSGIQITLKIHAPEAKEMKLSDRPDFEGAPWREVKEEQPWILKTRENQTVYTIYAVFRYHHPTRNRVFISPIVHDSIHLKEPHKNITRTMNGYFDWFDLIMSIQTQTSSDQENVDFITLQQQAETTARQVVYESLQSLPVQSDMNLEDFLTFNQWLLTDLREAIYKMQLKKIYYPDFRSVFLEQAFPLLGVEQKNPIQEPKLIIYHQMIRTLFKETPPTPTSSFTGRNLPALIIDTRGQEWSPTLFFEVVDNKGKTILYPSDSIPRGQMEIENQSALPFARYLRDLENLGNWKIPEGALVIKALEVNRRKNQIIILEKYGRIIRNSKKQVHSLTQGNFFIVSD